MDHERAVAQIGFLLNEIRYYRAKKWLGFLPSAVIGGNLYLFGMEAIDAIACGLILVVILEASADASLSTFRVRYAEMIEAFPDAALVANKNNPEPRGVRGMLRTIFEH